MRKLPRDLAKRIITHVRSLAEDPRPAGAKRLRGDHGGLYRLRVGDYRVVYEIDDGVRLVAVVGIGHRSRIYD